MERPGKLWRWAYRGARPNWLATVLNRWAAIVGAIGLGPQRLVTLEVRGRRSGRTISLPVMIAEYEGERYLVAMLGRQTRWVSNVRAASGQATIHHRRREPVRLVEVDPRHCAPILKRYISRSPGGRAHIPVNWRAPVSSFEPIAGQYPVFRVVSERSAPH